MFEQRVQVLFLERKFGYLGRPIPYSILIYDFETSCSAELIDYNVTRWFTFRQAMECAGKKFLGEHDFRNFCKMDAANVHNYRRNITSFEISPCKMRWFNFHQQV